MKIKSFVFLPFLFFFTACTSRDVLPTATGSFVPSPTATGMPAPTETPIPALTPTPEIKQFFPCLDPLTFRKCYVPYEDLIPKNPGEPSQYARWFKSLDWDTLHPIDLKKIKFNVPLEVYFGTIYYNIKTAPNFGHGFISPQLRLTFFTTEKDDITYFGTGVQIVVEGAERKNYPMIAGVSPDTPGYGYSYITGPQPKYGGGGDDKYFVNWYMNSTNYPTWSTTDYNYWIDIYHPTLDYDPIIRRMFETDPDIPNRIQRFVTGDMYALDGTVMPLNTDYTPGEEKYQK